MNAPVTRELWPHEVLAHYREREEANERRKREKELAEQQLVEARHQKFLAETAAAVKTAMAPAEPRQPSGVTAQQVQDYVHAVCKVIAKEMKADRARLDALEAKPTMQYQGVWDATKAYTVGTFCTHGGSLWCCMDTCVGVKPGSSNTWQLAAKRGSDGRDAKGSR